MICQCVSWLDLKIIKANSAIIIIRDSLTLVSKVKGCDRMRMIVPSAFLSDLAEFTLDHDLRQFSVRPVKPEQII